MRVAAMSGENGKAKAPLYARIPHDVIDRALPCGPHAVSVLAVLYRRASGAGESYPSTASIADNAGVSRRAVITSLAALEAAGILTREKRTKEDGSPDSNLYRVRVGGSAHDALGSAHGAQGVVQGGSAHGAHKELTSKEQYKGRTSASRFAAPSLREIREYCAERKNSVDAEKWLAFYESNGWRVGRNPMKDWRAAIRTWEHRDAEYAPMRPAPSKRPGAPAPIARPGEVPRR